MPIYEYQREDGSVFEITQRISDEPLVCCPETGQRVERLISRTAFHLKGGGWYSDGYSSSKSSSDSSSKATCADGKAAGSCACANAAASSAASSSSTSTSSAAASKSSS